MKDPRLSIRLFRVESLLSLVIFIIILLIADDTNSGNFTIVSNTNPQAFEICISQNQAVVNPFFQINLFAENRFDPAGYFRMDLIHKETNLENVRTGTNISVFLKIRQEVSADHQPILLYHIMVSEKDDYPHLS